MPRSFRSKCFYVPENAIDPARFTLRRQRTAARPIRAIFVGRLVPYKGADMLLEAAAPLLRSGDMTLDVIGDGPQMPRLRQMIETEQIGGAVRLIGWVDHTKLQQYLADSDVLAFPSIREFGGAVVLEAMAVGLTPIVVDYGGPAELVTDRTGYLVPIGPRRQIVARYRQLLSELAANPGQIDARSQAAFGRARDHFTWEAKARRVVEIYRWAIDPNSDKPNYPMPIPDKEGDGSF
jgi:glycosyltransferase involved in cell wall biosynthesis